jgi:hypothetical protein
MGGIGPLERRPGAASIKRQWPNDTLSVVWRHIDEPGARFGDRMLTASLISAAFVATIVTCFAPEQDCAGLAIGAVDVAGHEISCQRLRVHHRDTRVSGKSL